MGKKGYKNHFCSNVCSREHNKHTIADHLPQKHEMRREEYYKSPKKCLHCNSAIPFEKRYDNNYCSSKCAAIYTQKNGGHHRWTDVEKKILSDKSKTIIGFYKNNPKTGNYLNCPICQLPFYKTKKSKRICCSHKCYGEWAVKTGYMKGKSGGYRVKGGRGKQGWYKGYYCNSSWELAWVVYQLEHGVNFKRNTDGFQYEFAGKKLKFFPDFILENGDYVEVKGYMDDKVEAKFAYFPHKLQVIGKNDIGPFIQYVEKKYGKDYIKLYEPCENTLST